MAYSVIKGFSRYRTDGRSVYRGTAIMRPTTNSGKYHLVSDDNNAEYVSVEYALTGGKDAGSKNKPSASATEDGEGRKRVDAGDSKDVAKVGKHDNKSGEKAEEVQKAKRKPRQVAKGKSK